eukprot:2477573-Prymnesium_polylepis.2
MVRHDCILPSTPSRSRTPTVAGCSGGLLKRPSRSRRMGVGSRAGGGGSSGFLEKRSSSIRRTRLGWRTSSVAISQVAVGRGRRGFSTRLRAVSGRALRTAWRLRYAHAARVVEVHTRRWKCGLALILITLAGPPSRNVCEAAGVHPLYE